MAKISKYDGTHVRVAGRIERFDKGAAIPEHADAEHVKMLEERGMVEDGEPTAGLAVPSGPVAFDVDADAAAAKSKGGKKADG